MFGSCKSYAIYVSITFNEHVTNVHAFNLYEYMIRCNNKDNVKTDIETKHTKNKSSKSFEKSAPLVGV